VKYSGRRVHAGERPEEQPRMPARGVKGVHGVGVELGAVSGVRRETAATVRGGSMTASTVAQWR
jgi:hypothetical protein